ncbi:hypothetical protein psyc5s11_06470 [Clostridium gelidum]|uniref:Uncharacterized protein n=1 Tax=Clostridium gelidum TaxID=704125 RepID=A0ABM7SY84_9CLOT|nr:hypothetical protein [Clostridium gelidum]BCZ44580.1 hypothetical protein psyc5s11_06470 [Clostridium gelidum]
MNFKACCTGVQNIGIPADNIEKKFCFMKKWDLIKSMRLITGVQIKKCWNNGGNSYGQM